MKNPFTPSFGKVPMHMAGRENIVQDVLDALANVPGDPNLSTVLVGTRGTGKTALLTLISREARGAGWITADVSAREGMLESILIQARKSASHIIDISPKRALKAISIGQVASVEWENNLNATNWRSDMEDLLDLLADHDCGLLITVDEVTATLPEMIDLVSSYQHFVRDDRSIALLMAGLPFKVSELLSNDDISFMRRARHRRLGRIGDSEIREALRRTIEDGGRLISENALDSATNAINGFPFMMQLVGYKCWSQHPQEAEISLEDVKDGIRLAKSELADGIFDATWRELSQRDGEFLLAMLEDEGPSMLSDIAERMGVTSNYASQYRRRLLENGLLEEAGRGLVSFALPGFRDYLVQRS